MSIKTSGGKNAVRVTWAVLAAVSTSLLAGVTRAAEPGDAPAKQIVSYEDLNLSSAAGNERLYRRIQNAAEKVCGQAYSHDLHRTAVRNACIDRAVSQAVAMVNSPMLTSAYLARTAPAGKQLLANARPR